MAACFLGTASSHYIKITFCLFMREEATQGENKEEKKRPLYTALENNKVKVVNLNVRGDLILPFESFKSWERKAHRQRKADQEFKQVRLLPVD